MARHDLLLRAQSRAKRPAERAHEPGERGPPQRLGRQFGESDRQEQGLQLRFVRGSRRPLAEHGEFDLAAGRGAHGRFLEQLESLRRVARDSRSADDGSGREQSHAVPAEHDSREPLGRHLATRDGQDLVSEQSRRQRIGREQLPPRLPHHLQVLELHEPDGLQRQRQGQGLRTLQPVPYHPERAGLLRLGGPAPPRQCPQQRASLGRHRLDRQSEHGVQSARFLVQDHGLFLDATSGDRGSRARRAVAQQPVVRVARAGHTGRAFSRDRCPCRWQHLVRPLRILVPRTFDLESGSQALEADGSPLRQVRHPVPQAVGAGRPSSGHALPLSAERHGGHRQPAQHWRSRPRLGVNAAGGDERRRAESRANGCGQPPPHRRLRILCSRRLQAEPESHAQPRPALRVRDADARSREPSVAVSGLQPGSAGSAERDGRRSQ